ncbi:MAG: hypothetical protein IKP95_10790 [Ruminococcus sp.]|nr:hypothetical protein [Ruminococcus sp.]
MRAGEEIISALTEHMKTFGWRDYCNILYKDTLWSDFEADEELCPGAELVSQSGRLFVYSLPEAQESDEITLTLYGRMGGLHHRRQENTHQNRNK